MKWIQAAVVGSLWLGISTATAQTAGSTVPGRLRGHVESMGHPVPGADVKVRGGEQEIAHVRSDTDGNFFFTAVPEEFRITVSSPGYMTQQMSQDFRTDSTMTVFMLQPAGGVLRRGPVSEVADRHSWNYGVLAQGGVGLQDRSDFGFFNFGVRAGKVLTGEVGSGVLRGNFEYGVAVLPFWQSYTPKVQRLKCVAAASCSAPYTVGGRFTGVSVEPIQLRWNFTHGQRWMPWVQGAGGVVWTNHKYPAIGNLNPQDTASNGPSGNTSVWNFTPQFGVGTHYFLRQRRSLDVGVNAVHLSSASLGDKNPGVNTSVQFSLGYSWWK